MRLKPWLAVPVSLVIKLFVAALLILALTTMGLSVPTLSPQDGASWYMLMAANVLSAVAAGSFCARLSRPRDRIAPSVLVILLLASAFAVSPPQGANALQLMLWALGAPVGVVIGTLLVWRLWNAA